MLYYIGNWNTNYKYKSIYSTKKIVSLYFLGGTSHACLLVT